MCNVRPSKLCADDNRLASAMVGWQEDDLVLIQVIAHEIGHIMGIHHDFETNRDAVVIHRQETCGLPKNEGGEGNHLMNYGSPRQSVWSNCSNFDFIKYYLSVLGSDGEFCLSENRVMGKISTFPLTIKMSP